MKSVIHARLDEETENLLARLRRRTGLGDSELVRQGIRALSALGDARRGRKIIGLGKFASGVSDLGANKRHLAGFGRRS